MSGAGRRRYPSRSAKAVTGSGFLPDHRPGVGLAGCPDSAGHHPAARDPLSGCDRSGFLASVASLGYPAFPAVRSVLPGFRDPVSDCSGQPFALLKRASSRTSSKIDAISEDVFVADREAQPSSHRNDRIHRSVHSYCGRHHRLELPARIARVTTPPSRGRRRGSPGRDPRLREGMETSPLSIAWASSSHAINWSPSSRAAAGCARSRAALLPLRPSRRRCRRTLFNRTWPRVSIDGGRDAGRSC